MKPTIIVCGLNGANRKRVIEMAAPPETIPNSSESSQSVIYEADIADYIDCPIMPKVGENYIEQLSQGLGLEIDLSANCRKYVLWYCIELDLSEEDIYYLRNYKGAVIPVVITEDTFDPDELTKFYTKLEAISIEKGTSLVVSLTHKAGVRKLLTRTLFMLGKPVVVDVKEPTIYKEADSLILWAAGRAFCIAAVPLPMADVAPLIANEAYMFYKLGALYGYEVDQTVLTTFLGCIGASVGGKFLSSFIPFLKAPIAAGITYAVGVVANEYFSNNMQLTKEEMKLIFENAKRKAKSMKWN